MNLPIFSTLNFMTSSFFKHLYMSSSAEIDTVCLVGKVKSDRKEAQKSTNPLFSTDLNGNKSLHSHSTIRRPKMNRSSLQSLCFTDECDVVLFTLLEKNMSVNFFCLSSSRSVLTSVRCACSICFAKTLVLVPLE